MRFYSSLAFASAFLIACAGTQQDEAVPETAVPAPVPEQETAPAQPPIDNSTLPNILVTPAQNGKGISELQVVQNLFRKDLLFVQHLKLFSQIFTRTMYIHTVIFHVFTISGAALFVGKRRQDHSFVHVNSCGRKDILSMHPKKKQKREHR